MKLMKLLIRILLTMLAANALAQSEPEKFVVTADGARICYSPLLQARTVPVIVIAGGPGADGRYMRVGGALDELARTRSVVFYDQRGTRGSTDSNGTETIDQFVEDLEAVRKAVGAPKVDLLGHSFGGYLAIAYTARHPTAVRSLILVSSPGPKGSDLKQLMEDIYPDRIDEWRTRRATLGANATSADIDVFQSMEFVDQTVLEQYRQAVLWHRTNLQVSKALRAQMQQRDYSEQLRQFSQPALVLHGRFDAIISTATGWALHKALPNSTFHVLEATGHNPHIEKPAAFLALVTPFLQSLDRDSRR